MKTQETQHERKERGGKEGKGKGRGRDGDGRCLGPSPAGLFDG